MTENELVLLGSDISKWVFVKRIDPRPFDGYLIQGFYSERYEIKDEAEHFSMGRFYLGDKEMFRAWGKMSEEHCSFHALLKKSGGLSEPIAGCPAVSLSEITDTTANLVLKMPGETNSIAVEIIEKVKTEV